jgi:hypothetical protein
MKPILLFVLAATLSAETGIRARATAADYPAHATGGGAAVGAAILTPDQAKKLFAVDLTKMGYVVVEVGVYPDAEIEVAARDFLMRATADGSTLRPVAPSAIAAKLDKKDAKSSGPPKIPERVQVYGSETIGVGTGSYGGRRAGGVYTESTVGVGVGGPGTTPPPPDPPRSKGKAKDALSVQVELEDAALPAGLWSHPVAGYLYFPAPPKKSAVEITWYPPNGQVRLVFPAAK